MAFLCSVRVSDVKISTRSVEPSSSPVCSTKINANPIETYRCGETLWRVQRFPRVLEHRNRLELDVGELAVRLLDAPQRYVLDDVARLRVDHDRAARALRVFQFLKEAIASSAFQALGKLLF